MASYVGQHDGGAPTSGTYNVGDWSTDTTTPAIWICIAAGRPGTWSSTDNSPVLSGIVTAEGFAATGLTGSVVDSRYVGATTTSHPTTGAHLLGDWTVSQDGKVWICTTAGTPGTWTDASGTSATLANTVVGPDSFGGSATGGVAATVSRSDHDHGLPADPTTAYATAVVTETNKRITRRVLASTANSATPTANTDNYDVIKLTGQTTTITNMSTNLTGTAVDGDELRISITGSATGITWGSKFESSTVTLPTVTVLTNRLDCLFYWNTATTAWRIVLAS